MSEFSRCSTTEDVSPPFPSLDSAPSVSSKKWPHGPQGEPIISVTTIDYSPTRTSPFAGADFRASHSRDSGFNSTQACSKQCCLRHSLMKRFGRFWKRNRMESEREAERVLWNEGARATDGARQRCVRFLSVLSCGLIHSSRRPSGECPESSSWWVDGVAPTPSIGMDDQAFTIRVPDHCPVFLRHQQRWGLPEGSCPGWEDRRSMELVEGSDWSVQKVVSGTSLRLEEVPQGFVSNTLSGVDRSPPKESTWLEIRGYMVQVSTEGEHPGWDAIKNIAVENEKVPGEGEWQRLVDLFFCTPDIEFRSSTHWDRLKCCFLKPVQVVGYARQ